MDDADVTKMNEEQAKAALISLREKIRRFIYADGHDLCQINRKQLVETMPDKETLSQVRPVAPDPCDFIIGCANFRKGLESNCAECKTHCFQDAKS